MSAPAIQTDFERRRKFVDLNNLPLDPDGWCSFEHGAWKHTALCEHGVGNGGPRLCEMWAEKDRQDRTRESAKAQRQIADAELRRDGWFDDIPWDGGADYALMARQENARRGGDGR